MKPLQLGVPGQIMPPADAAVRFARRAEDDGYDAVWWPDHLMGWHPDTMWTPDLTPLAEVQANPHVYFDPMVMMGGGCISRRPDAAARTWVSGTLSQCGDMVPQ